MNTKLLLFAVRTPLVSVGVKRKMRFLLQLLIPALLTVSAQTSANAALLAYDGFRLSFPLYGVSGTGFSGTWNGGGVEVGDPSLCHPDLPTTGFSLTAGSNSSVYRNFGAPLGTTGSTVYMSFLLQPNSGDAGFSGFFLPGSVGGLFVGKPGGGASAYYVAETFGGSGQVATNAPALQGTTTLLVLKIQFNAGNELITLYANPRPGQPEPSDGFVKADLDLGTVSSLSFLAVGPAFSFDELRVGTSFADVVPVDIRAKCK